MKELLYDFYGYNNSIFYYINAFCYSHKLETPLLYISKIFNIENFAIYYIIAVILLLFPRRRESSVIIPGSGITPGMTSSEYDFMIRIGISYACFGLSYALLKFTINMPRPFCSLPIESFTTIMDMTHERCLSSFPSSHTGLAVLLTLSLWPYMNSILRSLSILVIALVAISRIALAMHYPADILYSFIIAFLVYRISCMVYKLFVSKR